MNNSQILKGLNSPDFDELSNTLTQLAWDKSERSNPLDPQTLARLISLLDYVYPDQNDPEREDLKDLVRSDALVVLGRHADPGVYDALLKFVTKNVDSETRLVSAVAQISRVARANAGLQARAPGDLANLALRNDLSSKVRNRAYHELLFLSGKIDSNEWAKSLVDGQDYKFDTDWLNSLGSRP